MRTSLHHKENGTSRGIATPSRSDAAFFEELESRLALSYSVAEWYPLTGGQNWHYTGTAGGVPATVVMSSTAGVVVNGQTTTRLSTQVTTSQVSTDSRFLKMSPTGLRLVRHDYSEPGASQSELYLSGGILLLPSTVNAGDYFTHSGSYTATSSVGPFSGTFNGSMTVYGEETLQLPAGKFQALRVMRTESSHAQGSGWSATTTLTETQWIVRGLGMVRLDFNQLDQYSSGEQYTTTLQLGLTSASLLTNLIGMKVNGLGQVIQKNDHSPTTADGTNYGGIDVNGATKTRVFTITNTSAQTLAIGSVIISGANAAEFTLVRIPAATLLPGQSTPLSVRFDPAATGFRYATISIPSSDPSANPYSFDIRGTGLYYGIISVKRIDKSTPIVAGSTTPTLDAGTSMGRTTAAGAAFIDRTFVITNTGPGNLVLGGMSRVQIVSGIVMSARIQLPAFTVILQPTATIAPGASSTFTIRFDPVIVGGHWATVIITSNDRMTPDFRFVIAGTGK
jgi:hypothetical protein